MSSKGRMPCVISARCGVANPMCLKACGVKSRPREVRLRKPMFAAAIVYPTLPALGVLTDYQPKIPLRVY